MNSRVLILKLILNRQSAEGTTLVILGVLVGLGGVTKERHVGGHTEDVINCHDRLLTGSRGELTFIFRSHGCEGKRGFS